MELKEKKSLLSRYFSEMSFITLYLPFCFSLKPLHEWRLLGAAGTVSVPAPAASLTALAQSQQLLVLRVVSNPRIAQCLRLRFSAFVV